MNEGVYNISQKLRLHNNQVLRGVPGNQNNDEIILNINHSDNRILALSNVQNVGLINFTIDANTNSFPIAILSYSSQDVTIAGIRLDSIYKTIGIGISYSTDVSINYGMVNIIGGASQDVDQAVWINNSNLVSIDNLQVFGGNDGPGGDGAVACFGSNNITIKSIKSHHSGSSAIYLNNCDDFDVSNNEVYSGSEWGIDIVNGSTDGTVYSNTVWYFDYGAMVFSQHDGDAICGAPPGNISITNNSMGQNNQRGLADCSGISITQAALNNGVVIGSGNTNSSGAISCVSAPTCNY